MTLIVFAVFVVGMFLTKGGKKRILYRLDSVDRNPDNLDGIENILTKIEDHLNSDKQ